MPGIGDARSRQLDWQSPLHDGTNGIVPHNKRTVATAIATVAGGVVTGIILANQGAGYTSAPTVTMTGMGTGVAATAAITGGIGCR